MGLQFEKLGRSQQVRLTTPEDLYEVLTLRDALWVATAAPTATLSMDLGGAGGDFHVCLPYAMLEPIRSIIYSSVQAERGEADSRWQSLLSAQIYRAEAELVADLAHATVSIGQLMSLQVGDVVAVAHPDSYPQRLP